MKKVSNTELSTTKCKVCGKPLKVNLLMKNPDADMCYICFNLKMGKAELRQNKKTGTIKIINLKERSEIQKRKYKKSLNS